MKVTSISSILPQDEAELNEIPVEKPKSKVNIFSTFFSQIRQIRVNKTLLYLSPIFIFIVTFMGIGVYIAFTYNKGDVLSESVEPSYNVYNANPKSNSVYELDVNTDDARPEKIKLFFEKHNAPLADYADFIVKMADKYDIDWTLVSAIGMCEGNGGKKIPEDSYNTWGWAASQQDLAEKSGRYNLGSWENAIEIVTRGLKKGYIDQGLETPEEIMAKYAPPSVEKGGPWAKCVHEYMEKIENTY